MSDAIQQIEATSSEAMGQLQSASNADALEQFRIRFLGTKGKLKDLMKLLGAASPETRPALGAKINALRDQLNQAFEERKIQLESSGVGKDAIDVTEPGVQPSVGRLHLLNKVIDELTDLFGRLGFSVAEGPELEDEWHNFVALNIPASHPARDPNDNFYLESIETPKSSMGLDPSLAPSRPSQDAKKNQTLLRTQTSTVQIRVMETQKPPIRVVIPGRVYRPDTTDATHLPMFHQLEALVVDRGVTMVNLKSTILQFARAYFGPQTRLKFRPSFFPFTEPSAEVDVWFEDKQRWIELGGCGMVHPNVLRNCGIDPEEYTGWAFGLGIERIAMRKYAIPDIRLLVENDLRFLRQF